MRSFVILIDDIAPLIYLVGLLAVLGAAIRFFRDQREVAAARHYAEREMYSTSAYRMGFVALGILLLMAATAFVDTALGPLVAAQAGGPATQPGTGPSVAGAEPSPTATLISAPRSGQVTVGGTVSPPVVTSGLTPGCPHLQARITRPLEGSVVSGQVQIQGSASTERFDRYRIEFAAGKDPVEWAFLGHGTATVSSGLLWSWDTAGLPPGQYALRLTVIDVTSNYPEPCVVHVTLAG
ncbi:MAG: hypothetical protein ACE5NC_01975 [Anaerolineae bacterium]